MSRPTIFSFAGIVIVVAIWGLSLAPITGELDDMPGNDKLHHALAYFVCMACWGQVFVRPLPRLKTALLLVLMGALVECVQGLTPSRAFEWLDMLANTAGVSVAWLVVTVQLAIQRRWASDHAGR
jgi:VanZ family protein